MGGKQQSVQGVPIGDKGRIMHVPRLQNSNGFFQSIPYHMALDSRKLEMHEQVYKGNFQGSSRD